MSVNGNMGGLYQSVYIPVIPARLTRQDNSPGSGYVPQSILIQPCQAAPGPLREVPVKKFATIGAATSTAILGSIGIIGYLAGKWPNRNPITMLLGSALSGAIEASLFAWIFNKTQKNVQTSE